MIPYSENECADYMKMLKGKLGGLLQFWHTSYNVLEHVEYITGGPSDRPDCVLDIGCADGQLLHLYKILHPESETYGVNLMKSQIDLCRNPSLSLRQADVINDTNWWPLEPVDKVFIHYTLGHLWKDARKLFSTIASNIDSDCEILMWDIAQKNVQVNSILGYDIRPPHIIVNMLEAFGFKAKFEIPTRAFIHNDVYCVLGSEEAERVEELTIPVLYKVWKK